MMKFAYVVPELEEGSVKHMEVASDSYRSGVILDGVMKFGLEPFW